MNPVYVFLVLSGYFGVLLFISHLTSRQAGADTYFTGNRSSPWYVVAFGMIGSSLSGITFISVPGMVGNGNFHYFQLVLGYLVGYGVIAGVLLPLYYRLKLVSIYGYLAQRFGFYSHKAGSLFFLLSQSIGAALRLFVVTEVLQLTFFDHFHVPFIVTILITLILIWAYTRKAGIKTIVWTDIFQTTVMLLAAGGIFLVCIDLLGLSAAGLVGAIRQHPYSTVFNWDWHHESYFFKQFVSGALVAIAMNGLDQNEMQKSLTCRNLSDARKNIILYSVILVVTNLVFLSLGVLLYLVVQQQGIVLPITRDGAYAATDQLFPMLSMQHLGLVAGFLFLLGTASAAFSSADSALAALTTAYCKDFTNEASRSEADRIRLRMRVNFVISAFIVLLILIFRAINDVSVVHLVYTIAGYTYGPLLGLFVFGLFTRWQVRDRWVPLVCVVSSGLSYGINAYSLPAWGIDLGYTVLLVNALITFGGLWTIRK